MILTNKLKKREGRRRRRGGGGGKGVCRICTSISSCGSKKKH